MERLKTGWRATRRSRWIALFCLTWLPFLRMQGCFDPVDAARERIYGWIEGPMEFDQDVVVVDLDFDPAQPHQSPPLWTRQALAGLIERLVADPPVRAVILDMHLGPVPPTQEPREAVLVANKRMGEALQTFLNTRTQPPRSVVLARHARLEPAVPSPDAPRRYDLEALEPLASDLERLPWGFGVLLTSDPGEQLVRRVPLSARVHHPGDPAHRRDVFALAALPLVRVDRPLVREESRVALEPERLRQAELESAWVRTDDRLRVELPHVPERLDGDAWLRGSSLLADDDRAAVLQQRLAGRLAVVGYASRPELDPVETLWGRRSGALVQAGLLSALYQGRAPWRSWQLDVGMQVVGVGLALLVLRRRRLTPWYGALALGGTLGLEWYAWRGLDLRLHGPVLELVVMAVWGNLRYRREDAMEDGI